MHEATKAPKISYYDYIVIGGGTTGIPIATSLSQNYSVLLLERGASPYGNPNVTKKANFGSYFSDNSPDSPSQRFVSVDGVTNARPRVLGGGTSINAGFYSHGDARFIKQAKLKDEWLINESYRWVEKVMVSKPVLTRWHSALESALVEADVTPENGFTYDHIIGTKVGGTIFDQNGTRHTAADLLQYANPKGLRLLLHATAHKILFKTKERSKPTAYGVVYEDASGKKHRAYLKGGQRDEIILSAGALGSPQLLMLSGVGPKDQLHTHNIKRVLHHPLIGQGMVDNPLNEFFVPSPIPVAQSLVDIVGITQSGNYIEAVEGFNLIGGTDSDYQGFSYEMGGFIFEKVNYPKSKGDLKLTNRNPADNPSVTFNYFKEPNDLRKCVLGLRTMLTAIESKSFAKFKYANMTIQDILDLNMKMPTTFPMNADTSSSLEQYCKDNVKTIWHYHGGCQMGKVVDADYKILGVDAVRVIDGSTLTSSPGTNPQASLLMLGRYMGVTILNKRLASDISK
ncbi:Glucose-methanol-choline oxidoreductase [Cynara cardunculus var. scolymus]|uniref:Glucose-methanol-choline oxidoreductase n=2 Tax=Cynara cardunculus var. scolymus TaxID=59895 RepID=A0A103Y210_CYNCS|nr:Glucose-methanol-choline oxidoreductase [Cynara cardunculus var. scolymus]